MPTTRKMAVKTMTGAVSYEPINQTPRTAPTIVPAMRMITVMPIAPTCFASPIITTTVSTDQLGCSSRRTNAQKSANKPPSPILIPCRTLRSRNRPSSGHSNLAGTLLVSVRAIIQP